MKKTILILTSALSIFLVILSASVIFLYKETPYSKPEANSEYDSTPNYLCLPTVFDALSIKDGTPYDSIVKKLGAPQERFGSGFDYRIWKLQGNLSLVLRLESIYELDKESNIQSPENNNVTWHTTVYLYNREQLQAEAAKIIIKYIIISVVILSLLSVLILKFKVKTKKKLFLAIACSLLSVLLVFTLIIYLTSPYCKTDNDSIVDATPNHFTLPSTLKALTLKNGTSFYEAINILGKPYSMKGFDTFEWKLADGNTFTVYVCNVGSITSADDKYENSTVEISSETRDELKLYLCESIIKNIKLLFLAILILISILLFNKIKSSQNRLYS